MTKQEESAQMALVETLLHLDGNSVYSKKVKSVLGTVKQTYPEIIDELKKQSEE